MVSDINIYQIGSGGTGAWAARALAYGFVNMRNLRPYRINWHIYDPDIIELKNQIRQPFVGVSSIGEHKAVYTMKIIYSILYAYENYKAEEIQIDVTPHTELIRRAEDIPMLAEQEEFLRAYGENTSGSMDINRIFEMQHGDGKNINILMLCVDNTYTRKVIEEYIDKYRSVFFMEDLTKRSINNFYIDTGNTDKMWVVTAVPMFLTPRIKYNEVTLPDPMLSCAARAETTTVPQTTHMNMVSGAYVAKSVLELINSVDEYYGFLAASIDKDEVLMYRSKRELIAAVNSFSDYRQFESWMLDLPTSSRGITDEARLDEIDDAYAAFIGRAKDYFTAAEANRITLVEEKVEKETPHPVEDVPAIPEIVPTLAEVQQVFTMDEG